jgi:hypothetical protein
MIAGKTKKILGWLGIGLFFAMSLHTSVVADCGSEAQYLDTIYSYQTFNILDSGQFGDRIRYVDTTYATESHYARDSVHGIWRYLAGSDQTINWYGQAPVQDTCNNANAFGSIYIRLPSGIYFDYLYLENGLEVFYHGIGYNDVGICVHTQNGGKYIYQWRTGPIPSQYWGTTITVQLWAVSSNGYGTEVDQTLAIHS